MNTLLKRILNYFRPQPRYIQLPIDDILANSQAGDIVERFNDFYYTSGVAGTLNWRGAEMIKNPCDLWTILELLQEIRPSVIIETGTHHGASSMFYGDMSKLFEFDCHVITIDINPKWHVDPARHNVSSVRGMSTDPTVITQVRSLVKAHQRVGTGAVLVFLDSDHSRENVINELETFSEMVTPGSYLIVEDTNVNGHPSFPSHGPGPWEAIDQFMATLNKDRFEIDRSRERFLLTFNPRGYLRRVG